MVFKFQRFQLALGYVVGQPIERGMLLSKATIVIFWEGGWFCKLKLICGVVF